MGYGPAAKGKAARASPYHSDDADTMVYLGNLPFTAEWQELKDFCSQAGTVEYARVLSTDGSTKATKGRSRGTGYVKFATAAEAKKAVSKLNGLQMDGRNVTVDRWTGSSKGSSWGGGKGKAKGAAWTSQGGMGRAMGDDSTMVYVGNLPFSAEWQELKDLFSEAGTVEYTRVLSIDGSTISTKGRSRGSGYVKFTKASEAKQAVEMFNGHVMDGRAIFVDSWTGSNGAKGKGKGGGKK